MAQRCMIVKSQSACGETTEVSPNNWSRCVLCPIVTDKAVVSPRNATNPQFSGYETLAKSIAAFDELGCVPMNINVSRLDDGNGSRKHFNQIMPRGTSLSKKHFSNLNLQRAQKTKAVDVPEVISTV